jgi:succinate-semialdehyde dehydrogenase
MRTVGIVNRIEDRKIVEIAEPFGVVAAVVPVDQPDVNGDLQDPHRLEGALRDRHQPHPRRRALHHAHGRDHG